VSLRLSLVQGLLMHGHKLSRKKPASIEQARARSEKVGQRMKVPADVTVGYEEIAGVRVLRATSSGRGGAVLHLHGGSYTMGSIEPARIYASIVSGGGPDLISVDYRLAPEHPYPAGLEDALNVYDALADSGVKPIVVMGESAGGGLAVALTQRVREEGLPMPAGVVALCPWVDLTQSGGTFVTNAGRDFLSKSALDASAKQYAGDRDLREPGLSPLFGSFELFPPTFIQVGGRDLLLDDSRRLAAALSQAGAAVTLREFGPGIHGFMMFPAPEGKSAIADIREFVLSKLG
jgi:acetyl esterase/lipase